MRLPRCGILVPLALSLLSGGHAVSHKIKREVKPNPVRYLLVSAPRESTVSYMRTSHVSLSGGKSEQSSGMEVLIDHGLVHPQGLAIEPTRQELLIADPGAKKIFAYPLIPGDGVLGVGPRTVLADGPEARWVATDAVGNIFFSDEPKNQILKISRDRALRGNATNATQLVYDGSSLAQVSAPGGIAIDSFHAYWVNKQVGTQVGSIIRAGESPDASNLQASVMPLARNTDKSYGVCLALNNVFFTQPETTLYGVKKSGGSVVTVSQRLTNPRGCAFDGDGTVFIADRGANAVYAFAGNMQELGQAQLTKVADAEDAFGVAVFSGASRAPVFGLAIMILARVAGCAM